MKAINKDILREILKTKSKFLSIVVIMFLGVFIFVGLKETSPAMENTYNKRFTRWNKKIWRVEKIYKRNF